MTTPEQYNTINGAAVFSTNTDVTIVAANESGNGISSILGVKGNDEISVPGLTSVEVTIGADNVSKQTEFKINGVSYTMIGDNDTVVIKDNIIDGLNATAKMTISAAGVYVVNGTQLTLTPANNVVVGEDGGAHLYDPNDIDFAGYTPYNEIIERIFGKSLTSVMNRATVSMGAEAANTVIADKNIILDASSVNVTVDNTNTAIVLTSDITDTKNVVLNETSDLAIVEATTVDSDNANISITVKGTADSVISARDVSVDASAGKNARLMSTGGNINVSGYDYSNGAGIQLTNANVAEAVRDGAVTFSGTSINAGSGTFDMTYSGDSGIVNLYNLKGEKQIVGYGDDVEVSYSGSEDIVMKGAGSTTLKGGYGNDSAFGGVGDYFDLGDGDNYVEISGDRSAGRNAIVALRNNPRLSGSTTVEGFKSGIDTGDDVVKVDASKADAKYTNEGLVFTYADATLNVKGVDAIETVGGISYVEVQIADSSTNNTVNTAIAREGAAIKVEDGSGIEAYVGQNSGIELGSFDTDENVVINLSSGKGTLAGDTVSFRGITSVKGGASTHTLIGSATESNTLEVGTGNATIYGGGSSSDVLIGNSNKEASQAINFIFGADDGADLISQLTFATSADETNKADRIVFNEIVGVNNYVGADVSNSGKDVIIKFSDSDDYLTVKDAVDNSFVISNNGQELISKVGKDKITYDGFTQYYLATDDNATINVASEIAYFNLANTDVKVVNVSIVDATNAEANSTIYGNDTANTLKGSTLGSILYGSARNTDDLLIGNSSIDSFYYSYSGGNDTIEGYGDTDVIFFRSMQTDNITKQFSSVIKSGDNVVVKMKNKQTLTIKNVNNVSDIKFRFQNSRTTNVDLQASLNAASSGDLAYDYDLAYDSDYWAVGGGNDDLLDGDNTFWSADVADDYLVMDDSANKNLTDDINTGDVNYSMLGGDTLYNFHTGNNEG